jgi:nucleotide-binding universal stress UspA family protein
MKKIKNILVTIDFSNSSYEVFMYGYILAKHSGAHLHLIHVIDPIYYTEQPKISDSEFIRKIKFENAQDELRKFKFEVPHSEVEITEVLSEGIPHKEILNYASENDIDLIVVASHGWTNLPHMLMGNIADKIMRQSEIPVICIKTNLSVIKNKAKVLVNIWIQGNYFIQDDINLLRTQVDEFMNELGFELEGEKEPVYGSFSQILSYLSKKPKTKDDLKDIFQKGNEAFNANDLTQPISTSTLNLAKSAASILGIIENFDNAAIKLGQIIVIKQNKEGRNSLFVQTIPDSIAQQLDANPDLIKDINSLLELIRKNDFLGANRIAAD